MSVTHCSLSSKGPIRRILLIEANESQRWIGGRVEHEIHVVPVALLGLAAFVRRMSPDTEIRVVESSLDLSSQADLVRLLDDVRPDLVGIRGINFFLDEVRRLVSDISAWREIPVVVGGPIATALGTTLFDEIPALRLAVQGEGEIPLFHLVRGDPPEKIRGMIVRAEGTLLTNPPGEVVGSLDDLPMPDYRKIDLGRYAHHLSYAYNQRRQGVLSSSRGCPYRCTFCFQTSSAPVRLRSSALVFEDIARLAGDHDVRDVYFVDDVFNLSRRRTEEILRLLIEANLGVRVYFVNGLRTDLCDEALVDMMIEAGTVWMTFGVETAHPRIAQLVRKELSLDHARRVIGHAQRSGIVANIDTMFGFPTETADEARATLDWLSSLPHPSLLPYHFNLRGYAGCEIVEQAEKAGWSKADFLATGFSSYNDLPRGSPSFPRTEMLSHLLEYHQRFGLKNPEHVRWSVEVLRGIGYSDFELVAMYSMLMNRTVGSVTELTRNGSVNSEG